MDQTKITAKIYEPMLKDFTKQIDSLFIKRDAFLDHMLQIEIPHLAKEMSGKRVSPAAKRYIAGQLKRLGTKPVNIVVNKSTSEALDELTKETNIVRDAFINRLIMLLRSSTPLLQYFELPESIKSSSEFGESIPISPIKIIEAIYSDPLHSLRVKANERHNTGLYLLQMPEKFTGLNCHMEDHQIPGTDAHAETEAMFDELFAVEAEAFQKSAARSKHKI